MPGAGAARRPERRLPRLRRVGGTAAAGPGLESRRPPAPVLVHPTPSTLVLDAILSPRPAPPVAVHTPNPRHAQSVGGATRASRRPRRSSSDARRRWRWRRSSAVREPVLTVTLGGGVGGRGDGGGWSGPGGGPAWCRRPPAVWPCPRWCSTAVVAAGRRRVRGRGPRCQAAGRLSTMARPVGCLGSGRPAGTTSQRGGAARSAKRSSSVTFRTSATVRYVSGGGGKGVGGVQLGVLVHGRTALVLGRGS